MTQSKLTDRVVSTPNFGSRSGARVRFIVLHHMASTGFEGVLSSWHTGSKQGSAHYAIGNEGQIVRVVPEELRAWSLSDAAFDSKSIVFEIENASVGGDWPVSAQAEEATAQVVADLCRRYNIACNRTQILGHREVYSRYGAGYATACPGGLHLDGIVKRAQELLRAGGDVPVTKPASGSVRVPKTGAALTGVRGKAFYQRLQMFAARFGYSGPIDGVLGTQSWAGIQRGLPAYGYSGPADGTPGVNTYKALQRLAAKKGGYLGPIDGKPGLNTWRAVAKYLNTL